MRKEIIIRMQPDSDKGCNKALKVAASVSGVESVTVTGAGKDHLLVIGDCMDAGKLTRKLQKEVGEAEIVELRTLPGRTTSAVSKDVFFTLSPYQRHPTPGRSVPGGGRIECPVAASSRWPGKHSRHGVGYYHRTPSPGYYQHCAPSPLAAGQGSYGYAGGSAGGGSLYVREVARSHPANYSPMIARHDLRAVGHTPPRATAGGEGREHGGGGPNCCSIL
uniref:HMA domain-containing protein n=2 Tax=Setaria italica TaxID=4555 RepID=K3YD47_SETIT